jgi:hypothetical protein
VIGLITLLCLAVVALLALWIAWVEPVWLEWHAHRRFCRQQERDRRAAIELLIHGTRQQSDASA